ncbi:MAG: HEPN domain-containing protein [Oscillospiraceae bacterium]|nr:HEPN domain-containing protein [Oscillospiraceae bacterium]
MPEITVVDLSRYRLEKAGEMLESARRDYAAEDYASANNRAYYCIFHAMRAVLAMDGEDYKKHSAVIARFTLNYLKPEILPRQYGKLITNASLIRNRSDYEDFYICSIRDTEALISGAAEFLPVITDYLAQRWKES